jgi:hypothetical protein
MYAELDRQLVTNLVIARRFSISDELTRPAPPEKAVGRESPIEPWRATGQCTALVISERAGSSRMGDESRY